MPRIARIVVPAVPHHFTQRGNNRQQVFFGDADRRQYLAFLAEETAANGLDIWAYCLMTNHVHLIATPRDETAAARAIGRTHFRYSQYLNRRRHRCGHLWQGRFYSTALDEPHFWAAAAYVERNPVRARLVHKAWQYRWSSAAAHTGRATDELIDLGEWRKLAGHVDWQAVLTEAQQAELVTALRSHSRTGRPLGSESFLARLEAKLGCRVRALPVGRPRTRRSG
jgi:putative transposase